MAADEQFNNDATNNPKLTRARIEYIKRISDAAMKAANSEWTEIPKTIGSADEFIAWLKSNRNHASGWCAGECDFY